MITCAPNDLDRFRCPTKWELWRQIMALLPRGRAWQTHDAGAELIIASESSQAGLYEAGSTGLGTEPVVERLSVMQQFWAAYAEVLEYLHARACALLEEMYCATTAELVIEWGHEFGFPDDCDPWDTLCEKVAAQGGATCAYLASLAARLGFYVECINCEDGGAEAGCAEAGLSSPCVCTQNEILIRIIAARSPAFVVTTPFEAGAAVAGCTPPCPPAAEPLVCLIERYKPAHVRAIYEVV